MIAESADRHCRRYGPHIAGQQVRRFRTAHRRDQYRVFPATDGRDILGEAEYGVSRDIRELLVAMGAGAFKACMPRRWSWEPIEREHLAPRCRPDLKPFRRRTWSRRS